MKRKVNEQIDVNASKSPRVDQDVKELDPLQSETMDIVENNLYPIIGILSHPGDGASGRTSSAEEVSNIPASYVRLLQAGGARVIPLFCTETHDQLLQKLNLVDGVIFTGGRLRDGPYYDAAKIIFKHVESYNNNGRHFPLLGICLGFQNVCKIVNRDQDIVERHPEFRPSTLSFNENIDLKETMFKSFSSTLVEKMKTNPIVAQSHNMGISVANFQNNSHLTDYFQIVTTSSDENSQRYVSTIQSREYPITCTMWHPEKPPFEWNDDKIPHSDDSIGVSLNVARFFIREARISPPEGHGLTPALAEARRQQIRDQLIYNYQPYYSGRAGKGFVEVYVFQPPNQNEQQPINNENLQQPNNENVQVGVAPG